MQIAVPAIDPKLVYLKSAAQQMGLELLEDSLALSATFWGSRKKCLKFTLNKESIAVSGYGLPETVIKFCGHLEHAYGVPVNLEFRSDEPVDLYVMRYF